MRQDVGGLALDLDDDDAISLGVGIRSNITDRIEINTDLAVVSFNDDETVGLTTGMTYQFPSGFGLTLYGTIDEDDNKGLYTGIRYTF